MSSDYPTVALLTPEVTIAEIAPGAAVDLSGRLTARFTAGADGFAPARIDLRIGYDGGRSTTDRIDLLVIPEQLPAPDGVEVLDGRSMTFHVFRQAGNQGGGASIERHVTEGSGNGNGILEPGEEATIWVRMVQGMDPFDKNNWYRAKVYSDSPWIEEVQDIQEQKQREWTSAQSRTSVIRLSPDAPPGEAITLLLDNESWSFQYTPDFRYGGERLYQAFQLHRHHLHRFEVRVR